MEELKNNREAVTEETAAESAPEAVAKETPEAAAHPEKSVPESLEPADETGVIAAHTKVVGDIITRGHLIVHGEVQGNISAAGNVTATGKIFGDIICNSLKLSGCTAKSNLTVKDAVIMDGQAGVEGEIKCRVLSVDGAIKGNIEATDEISIHSNARIAGGIRTKSIGVEPGAQLSGSINVVK